MSSALNDTGLITAFADMTAKSLAALNLGWEPLFFILHTAFFFLHYLFAGARLGRGGDGRWGKGSVDQPAQDRARLRPEATSRSPACLLLHPSPPQARPPTSAPCSPRSWR
jgi:hypothetical protein